MKTQFKTYLIEKGYSLTTPSGYPSTVYDYQKRIDKVCVWEHCTWEELASNIENIVIQYDIGGDKEQFGKRSHSAVINALKRYRDFTIERIQDR